MKKLTGIILTLSLVFGFAIPSHASSSSLLSASDPYASGYSETLCFDGESYTLTYSLTSSGERKVVIADASGKTDVMHSNADGTIFYLNNTVIATMTDEAVLSTNTGATLFANDGWSDPVYYTSYISWAEGATVFVVATAIGLKLGGPVGSVIAACGSFYAMCIGGTLDWYTQYNVDNGFDPKLRTTWTFTASTNDVYGPFSFTITR